MAYGASINFSTGNTSKSSNSNGDDPVYIKIDTSGKKITVTRKGLETVPHSQITMTITGSGLSGETLGGSDYLNSQNGTWKFHAVTGSGEDIVSYSSLEKIVLSDIVIPNEAHVVIDGTSKGTFSEGSTIYSAEEEPGPGPKPGILDWIKNHLMIVGGAAGGLIFLILILVLVM